MFMNISFYLMTKMCKGTEFPFAPLRSTYVRTIIIVIQISFESANFQIFAKRNITC
jgi:hypothetical protein